MRRSVALGHLVSLWLWALDNAPDGDLRHIDERDVADAADWPKKPRALIEALVQSRFLDDTESGLMMHDWQDYAGRLLTKRAANAERMRAARAQHGTQHGAENSALHVTPHVQGLPTAPTTTTQPTTATAPSPTAHGAAVAAPKRTRENDPAIAAVFTAYENYAGLPNGEVVKAILERIDGGTNPDWIVAACQEAALQGGKSWNYVVKKLNAWAEEGFKAPKRGSTANGRRPDTGTQFLPEAYRDAPLERPEWAVYRGDEADETVDRVGSEGDPAERRDVEAEPNVGRDDIPGADRD